MTLLVMIIRYLGSKNKISKELAPIIQSYITADTKGYLEPFVGGANMIDKIKCHKRIGCDIHKQLIALLKYAQTNVDDIPEKITEEEYMEVKANRDKYPDWYVGLVGFCASYGARYFEGYARDKKGDNSGKWSTGAIRNLKKQAANLSEIEFRNMDYKDIFIEDVKGYVIYCDIPYRGRKKYATGGFDYEHFYNWARCMSRDNIVLVSEYSMPEDFICIWQKETTTLLDSQKTVGNMGNKRIEKLYICKRNLEVENDEQAI